MAVSLNRSHTGCSVLNCKNYYGNSPEGVKFYRFPSSRIHSIKRNIWINALKRKNLDGTDWNPKNNDRVCSQHFAGGEKSDDPLSPSYFPTLNLGYSSFNKTPEDLIKSLKQESEGFGRLVKRRRLCNVKLEQSSTNKLTQVDERVELREDTKSIATQTELGYYNNQELSLFSCCFFNGSAATQANLPVKVTSLTQMTSTRVKGDIPVNRTFIDGLKSLNEEELLSLAGVRLDVFTTLLKCFSFASFNASLSKEDRLLLFLVKIKLGISFSALGALFGIHQNTAEDNFKAMLNLFYFHTKKWIFTPSKSSVREALPSSCSFKAQRGNCRFIIDCTEISCERPAGARERVLMYSQYKGTFTTKYLIAITPNGFVSFVSKGYGGRCTDSFITVNSGFLELIEKGDEILADKSFPQIAAHISESGCALVTPPFSKDKNIQFTASEVQETYNNASVRIHVERIIQRMKIYKVLRFVPRSLLSCVDKIVHVAAVLSNLQPPIINELSEI